MNRKDSDSEKTLCFWMREIPVTLKLADLKLGKKFWEMLWEDKKTFIVDRYKLVTSDQGIDQSQDCPQAQMFNEQEIIAEKIFGENIELLNPEQFLEINMAMIIGLIDDEKFVAIINRTFDYFEKKIEETFDLEGKPYLKHLLLVRAKSIITGAIVTILKDHFFELIINMPSIQEIEQNGDGGNEICYLRKENLSVEATCFALENACIVAKGKKSDESEDSEELEKSNSIEYLGVNQVDTCIGFFLHCRSAYSTEDCHLVQSKVAT